MAGANAHQKVSDHVYEDLLNKTKTELLVQVSDYYTKKLKGKKYLIIENDENPKKPNARFLIQSITEVSGHVVEYLRAKHRRAIPEDKPQAQAEDEVILSL